MPEAELVAELREVFPSLSQFCGACLHSRFVHGDDGLHPCFFDSCGCQGWIKGQQPVAAPTPPRLIPAAV